jgi:hypothetical protein
MEQIGRVGLFSTGRVAPTPTLQSNFYKIQFRGVPLKWKTLNL